MATAIYLIEKSDEPVTLSRVARKASLAMTALYNYFSDITELLQAVLDPVMATAQDGYLFELHDMWGDDDLFDRCYRFVRSYHLFWVRYSRLLHLRNTSADAHEQRMMQHRIDSSRPIIRLIIRQMGNEHLSDGPCTSMATVLMITIERAVTLVTDQKLRALVQMGPTVSEDRYLIPSARLLEFAIRDARQGKPK